MQKAVKPDSTASARKKAVINLPVSKKATNRLKLRKKLGLRRSAVGGNMCGIASAIVKRN